MRNLLLLGVFAACCGWLCGTSAAEEAAVPKGSELTRKLTTRELADWIDEQFGQAWKDAGVDAPAVVDDATYLRRVSLDLAGCIPSVSSTRDFMAESTNFKRDQLVLRVLNNTPDGNGLGQRSAEHLARVWRRVILPSGAPSAQYAPMLDPWLKSQFEQNVPYDELVRKLVLARAEDSPQMAVGRFGGTVPTGPIAYYQAVGATPENLANAVTKTFLGVRIGCAQCHNHPFAHWKQADFWGIAAFFGGMRTQDGSFAQDAKLSTIRSGNGDLEYEAHFLWGETPTLPEGKTPREFFIDWMVAADNPNFASTAVNRVWQYLCGRGVTSSVDDLDDASPEERQMLSGLARQFVAAQFDVRWLITGICQSQVYQRATVVAKTDGNPAPPGARPLKTLLPEQVFGSLEQALALPVSKVDNGPRHNGQMAELVSRMNEAIGNTPEDFRGGIPQTLLMMNGTMIAKGTDLKESRTLRGVVEAPFLSPEQKLEALYLAAFTRLPTNEERQFFLEHVRTHVETAKQKEAYGEIFWGLLNSPEFVLSR